MYRILIVEDDAGIAEAVSEHVSCDEQIGAWTSNRSSPAGLEHRKKSHPSDDSFFYLFESTRRDSNPRPSPWQGDTPPLSHSCTHTFKTTY